MLCRSCNMITIESIIGAIFIQYKKLTTRYINFKYIGKNIIKKSVLLLLYMPYNICLIIYAL